MDSKYSVIVEQASRAANAHNTQPWVVSEESGELVLRWDPDRALGPSDPRGRDTMMSLGTFIETLLICAASAGIGLSYTHDHDPTDARVGRFVPVRNRYKTSYTAQDVRERRMWRGRWLRGRPDLETLEEAAEIAGQAGFRLVEMPVEDARHLLVRANRWFFGDSEIVVELHDWTRLSPRHPDYRRDGLNDVMLVLSRAERWLLRTLIRPSAYRVLRGAGLPELLARMSVAATRGSGLALGLVGPSGTVAEIEAGRLLMRLWISLLRKGLFVHPQSHVIDCPETRWELEARWQVGPNERLVSWFRVGHPASDPHARPVHPRRT